MHAVVPTWVPVHRALHLHDVENLVGDPLATSGAIAAARDACAAVSPPAEEDLVVIGCHPRMTTEIAASWFSGQLLARKGSDGADLALLDAADPDDLSARFHRVVIGSGDGIFTPLARELRWRGVEVHVVARLGALSPSLARAAHVVAPIRPAASTVTISGWAA